MFKKYGTKIVKTKCQSVQLVTVITLYSSFTYVNENHVKSHGHKYEEI